MVSVFTRLLNENKHSTVAVPSKKKIMTLKLGIYYY